MSLKSPGLRGFYGIIKTAPKSACNTHRGLTRSSGTSREGLPDMVPKTCSIADCESAKYCRGWCVKHYARWRQHGAPTITLAPVAKTCAVETCDSKQHAHDYCASHLYHAKKYGDPLAVGPGGGVGRSRMSAPGYHGVHKRLSRERGKASAHPCADCGKRAHEWSYNDGCPNELYEVLEKLPIAYSTDQTRYSPRCRPCHRNRDESLNRPRGADGKFTS